MAEGDRSEQSTSGRSVRHRVSWASVAATLILLVAVIIFGTIAYEFPPAMVGDVLVVHPLTARRSAGASVAPAESSVPGLAVMEIIQRDWCMQRYDCGRERRGMARRNGGGVLETNALSGKLVIMAGATIMEDYLIR